MMKTTQDALIIVNEHEKVLSFNDSAESLFYIDSESVLGKSLESLNHRELYQQWLALKSSSEDSSTSIIPESKIRGVAILPLKVKFVRSKLFPDNRIIYNIAVEELPRDNIFLNPAGLEDKENPFRHLRDLFDLDKILRIQEQFASLTGLASVIVDPEGTPIGNPVNFSGYCRMIRNSEEGCRNCIRSDKESPDLEGGVRIYRCKSGGLWDCSFPIVIDGKHIATLLVGQVRVKGYENECIKGYARSLGVDAKMLQKEYESLPLMTYGDFEETVLFLKSIVNQIITIASQNLQQRTYIEERREFIDLTIKREEYLQGILKIAPVGIGVLDIEKQFVQVNNRVCSITGYSPEELLNRKADFLFRDADECARVVQLEAEQLKQSGITRVETEWRHKKGHLINVLLRLVPMDKNDISRGYVSRIQDITLEKQYERERDILVSAVENTQDSVFVMDNEGDIIYVNPEFEKLTGYSASEVMHQNPRILNSGSDEDSRIYQEMMQTMKSGKPWKGRVCNRKKDGTLYTGDVLVTPVKNHDGEIENFVSVKRDITEQLRIEEDNRKLEEQFFQTQKEESIGRLAGGIAHDLNNLLSPILGYSEMLIDDADQNETRQKRIIQIYEAGERARKMVKQLLTFSRKQDLEFQLVDLNTIITNFVPLLRRTIKENINLEMDLNPSLPPVNVDTGKIEQILMNLVVNSQDSMPRGGVLKIRTNRDCSSRPPLVSLSVTDTGCGISREDLEKIFEPFFSTKGNKGTGLGLANVQRIIKQHKGEVEVSSTLNSGTVVTISLPSAEKTGQLAECGDSQAWELQNSGCNTVLLVEDDKQVREVTSSMLDQHGFQVLQAESAESALKMASEQKESIQLLLTDMVLPGKNGLELYRHLVQDNPDLSVLFMSGYMDISGEDEYKSFKNADFIQKPLLMNELLQKVYQLSGYPSQA